MELLLSSLLIMGDWYQTIEMAKNPEIIEVNRMLGEQPTNGKINRHFATMLAVNYFVKETKYKETVWMLVIGAEGNQVWMNYNIMQKF